MNIYLDMVGCRLNQSEIEKMANQFRAAGHRIVETAGDADMVVVNTCAVTTEAASDSRQKVRQAFRAGAGRIAVTGCWATMEPAAAAALPGVSGVFTNLQKDELVQAMTGIPEETFDREPLAREPLPGMHMRTRAFIKVQEGCDNHCTFCITRVLRGPGQSRKTAEVLADIHAAYEGGAQEVVLTGVHLGSWGQDFDHPMHLHNLVEAILMETEVPRLRLSSLEPWDLDGSFFSLWQDSRLCRHLHLPLQAGAEATLRRMARKTTPESFARLVEEARSVSPEIAITTDVIAGFPGESDQDFEDSLEFIRAMQFSGGHVFTYSARSGTPAARYRDQVPHPVRKERNAKLREVFSEASAAYARRFTGRRLEVLWESAGSVGPEGWKVEGLSDNYLRVWAVVPQNLWNKISQVEMVRQTEQGFFGQLAAA